MSKPNFEIRLDAEQSSAARALRQLVKRTIEGIFELGEAENGLDADGRPHADGYVERAVTRALEPMIQRVLLDVLGVDNRWSRVEIRGDSALGTAVKRRAETHAEKLVGEFIETKGWPKLSASDTKALAQSAKDAMREELHKRIVTLATERAAQIPNETLLPLVDQVLFDKYPVLKALEAMNRLGAEDSSKDSEPR